MTSSERSAEQVEPGGLQQRFALRAGRHADRFDDLDPVWLDDGPVARLGHGGLLHRIYQLDRTSGQERGGDGSYQRLSARIRGAVAPSLMALPNVRLFHAMGQRRQ